MNNITELPELLNLGLDCYIQGDGSLRIHADNHWGASTLEDYNRQEELIQRYKWTGSWFDISCWCDISGYEYWMLEEQAPNYLSISVRLDLVTFDEVQLAELRAAIAKCTDYFDQHLTDRIDLIIDKL